LAAVGVKLNLYVAPTAGDWIQHVLVAGAPMHELAIGNASDSVYEVYSRFIKPGSILNNIHGGWQDSVLFSLWARGSRAANPSVYWRQINERIVKRAYFVPLVVSTGFGYVNSKKVKNVALSSYGFSLPVTWAPKP